MVLIVRWFAMIGAFCALSGCAELQSPGQFSSAKTAPFPLAALFAPPRQIDDTFERAPELFRMSGVASWNGGGTVAGVWVTHPDAASTRRVRIVNTRSGVEIDGMLYKADETGPTDAMVVSSDVAQALSLPTSEPILLTVYGLRPKSAANKARAAAPAPVYGGSAEETARSELANHVARMDDNQLLQLVAATVRGMGYATEFETQSGDVLSNIRAFPGLDGGAELDPLRVIVRRSSEPPASAEDVTAVQSRLTDLGEFGALVSVSGFADGAEAGLTLGDAHLQMVDLNALLALWVANYDGLSAPDQSLMPVQPVYVLAEE